MSDKLILQRTNTGLLLALTAVVAVIFSLLPRIPQPQSYHLFADRHGSVGIPNFGDVVSNVPFGVIGIGGVRFLLRSLSQLARTMALRAGFHWFASDSIRLVLISLVSKQPRLVWDRLPMTIAFMVAEQVHCRPRFLHRQKVASKLNGRTSKHPRLAVYSRCKLGSNGRFLHCRWK